MNIKKDHLASLSSKSSLERMNHSINPNDPLGMVNYCLYKYVAEPIFLTRLDRQGIEAFLHDESMSLFTLQSGEILSREKAEEYLNTYENSMYRIAILNKIFYVLEESAEKLNNKEGKDLEKTRRDLFSRYDNELKQQKIENTPLIREAIEEFLSQNPNSPVKKELEQAINQYDEQYGAGINSENVEKAAHILIRVIEDLDGDKTIRAFKDKVIKVSYSMSSRETIKEIRDALILAQQLLRKEEGFI